MKRKIITIENDYVFVPPTDIWMTQHEITNLFGCFVSKVNSNIRSILKSGVLCEADVCRIYHYSNGNSVEQYSLEVIIALAFRIRTHNAEVFRQYILRKAIADTSQMPILLYRDLNDISLN